jgi:cytochrome b subunit of formate dehydrogenase
MFKHLLARLALLAAVIGSPVLAAGLDNASCLSCHDTSHDAINVPIIIDGEEDERELTQVDPKKYSKSVHKGMQCLDCHKEIVDSQAKHKIDKSAPKADCITCHQDLWAKAKQAGKSTPGLELVKQNIEAYKKSFHAKPDKDIPGKPMAACGECHSSHSFNVPPKGSEARNAWHQSIPETCGSSCHEDQLEIYTDSIHGTELLKKGNLKAAVCTDCHSAHSVTGTSNDAFKLKNVETCGNCHKEQIETYTDTYHGQVNKLGYTYTAKCVDCHDSHGIRAKDDPKSKVHPDNRMKTCQKCHDGTKPGIPLATAGFASFAPHANAHDFDKYPQVYVVTKFMIWLLIGVFAFFWLHSALWYYREWRERKLFKTEAHVRTEGLDLPAGKHFERFAWGWRVGHLFFAITTMTLVLTGSTALFADSAWAPTVAKLFGGPQVLGLIHRVAAGAFIGIFFIHLIYVMQKLLRTPNFKWFGPDSLVPNWKDLDDMIGMFKWFFGKGPKPRFERWTYFEKFDYWAVFWGVNVIGWSGMMLAFPHVTATYLPGWVFNVATIVHGEEAFLAAVFLFTVHFFNNHFRPNKLPPPDVVMFTGTQSLEEFRHEHPAQYQRLLDSGELQKRLVDAPSRPLHVGSVILGLVLISIGLTLLVLVGTGFFA